MTHSIINQNGKYIIGKDRDAVIDAVMRDVTLFEHKGHKIEIVSHTFDENGNKITNILVEFNNV